MNDGRSDPIPDLPDALSRDPVGMEPPVEGLEAALAALRPLSEPDPARRLAAIAPVLDRWQDPRSATRRTLARHLPSLTGFSPEMIEVGLPLQCARLSVAAFEVAIREGHPRLALAGAPPTGIVGAGNIPALTAREMLLSVLAGAPVAAKLASVEPLSGILLCHELAEHLRGAVPALSLRWRGGDEVRNGVLFGWAEQLLAYGSDPTIEAIRDAYHRRREGMGSVFAGFGHRVSAAWIPASGFGLEETAARLAVDTALWDQEGCLSPHVAFVASGVDAVELGQRIATHLDQLENRVPREHLGIESAAAVRRLTLAAEARMLRDDRTRLWAGERWAVILDPGEALHPSPLGRTLILKPMAGESDALGALAGWTGHVQCLGVAADPAAHRHLVAPLERLGATRLCALGRMQEPGPAWVGEECDPGGRPRVTVETEMAGVWSTLVDDPAPPIAEG